MNTQVIKLKNITARVFDQFILKNTSWELRKNENWLIIGPNGSGKSSFIRVLSGDIPVVRGSVNYAIDPKSDIAVVSFENLRALLKKEEIKEDSRFFSGDDSKTTVTDILGSKNSNDQFIKLFNLEALLNKSILDLSTGERRKVLITKALLKKPKLLILDEPFEGLDLKSKKSLKTTIESVINKKVQVILVTHRFDEVPDNIKNVLPIKNLQIKEPFLKKDLNTKYFENLYKKKLNFNTLNEAQPKKIKTLVKMDRINIRYDDKCIFENLSWEMKSDENWRISGPNGSGKSTLLSLISADNLLAYSNNIYLFGQKRGSGETIFDIKKKIGIVTPNLQLKYTKKISVLDVVLSGFFDSIGLYQKATQEQIQYSTKILKNTEIDSSKRFDHLSYGEQRVILILRAIIKTPEILILDEPCQGLDPFNQKRILDICDQIAINTNTRILFVSHNRCDNLRCINRELILNYNGEYLIKRSGV